MEDTGDAARSSQFPWYSLAGAMTPLAAGRMDVDVVVDGGADESNLLDVEWDALADAVSAPCWWRPTWVRAWMQSFGHGHLTVVTLRRNGELAAIVPLVRVGSELRSTTNYHTPSFGLLARDERSRTALADEMLRLPVRRISIGFLPASHSSLTALASAAVRAGRRHHARVLERCPYIVPKGDFTAYLSSRGGNLARELRRRERRLRTRGTFTFEVHEGGEDLARLLADGFAVEASGWKGTAGTAIASGQATRSFYESIAQWLSDRGALRLAFLRSADRAIAFDFAIEEAGVHSLLKTGYDPAFRADGPGVLLRAKMIERAFGLGLNRYNFLGHDDPWKRQWSSVVEEQILFQAFRGPNGVADWIAQRYLRPVARRVMKR